MARRRKPEEHENHERWLVSYADMVTLLMVFFIVLYASSQINVSKYKAIQEAAADSLGAGPTDTDQVTAAVNKGGTAQEGPIVVTKPGKDAVENPNEELLDELQEEVEQAGLKSTVQVYEDARGVVVYFTDRVLFEPGRADVLPAGSAVLRRLSPILADTEHPVVVEGHTDNRPISTARFPSNWELSTTRATQVLRTLLGGGVPPTALAAAGYADTHPKAPNATAGGRQKNRRVEVVIVTPESPAKSKNEAATSSGVVATDHEPGGHEPAGHGAEEPAPAPEPEEEDHGSSGH